MKLRLEVAKGRSYTWPWALRAFKTVKGHRVTNDGGLEVHEMDFDSVAEFAAIYDLVRSWKMVSVYRDGKLMSRTDAFNMFWKERQKDAALDDLTRTLRASADAARRRGRDDVNLDE